jgi:hypothetical protein
MSNHTNTVTTLTECYDSSEGVIHIHAPGCRDIASWKTKSFDGDTWPVHVTAGTNVAQAEQELAEDFNSDFADDEGMTPAEYIEAFGGYPVHILPCAAKLIEAVEIGTA